MLRKATVSVLLTGMFFSAASMSYGAKKVSNHQLQASDVLLRGSISYLMNTASGFELGAGKKKISVDSSAKPTVDLGGLFMATDDIGVSLGVTIPASFSDAQTKPEGNKKGKMEYKPTPIYLTGQYYFPEMANGLFRIYAGVGAHYTMFSDEKYFDETTVKAYNNTELDDQFSWLVEGGALFAVDSTIFVDVSVKYFDLTTNGKTTKLAKGSTSLDVKDYKIAPVSFNIGAGMVF